MDELFKLPVLLGILYSGIRLATPYLYASIGETIAQTSGVYNLGVDGIMLMGAFTGFYVGMKTGNLMVGSASSCHHRLSDGFIDGFYQCYIKS